MLITMGTMARSVSWQPKQTSLPFFRLTLACLSVGILNVVASHLSVELSGDAGELAVDVRPPQHVGRLDQIKPATPQPNEAENTQT